MKKYTDIQYKIFENIAQAKSILRKNNGSQEDEDFQKIVSTTNKDGWTGLLTRLVYKDGVDVDEVISFYPDLKKSKMDLGKLNKMSYDDIIDLLYQESDEKTNDVKFVGKVQDYLIFHVLTFESNLKICSPSWCIKTKNDWNGYVQTGNSEQFVVIQSEYVNKSGRTKLLTPDSPAYMGNYFNRKKPEVRYGITYYKNGETIIFDDNNKSPKLQGVLSDIVKEINKYVLDEKLFQIIKNLPNDEYEKVKTLLIAYIQEENPWSWDNSIQRNNIDYDESYKNVMRQIYTHISEEEFKNWWNKYSSIILTDGDLIHSDGLTDYILYILTNKNGIDETPNHPLSGLWLSERDESDNSYKFFYGFHKNKYGKIYISQSYGNISDWFEEILKNLFYVFYEESLSISIDSSYLPPWYNQIDKQLRKLRLNRSLIHCLNLFLTPIKNRDNEGVEIEFLSESFIQYFDLLIKNESFDSIDPEHKIKLEYESELNDIKESIFKTHEISKYNFETKRYDIEVIEVEELKMDQELTEDVVFELLEALEIIDTTDSVKITQKENTISIKFLF